MRLEVKALEQQLVDMALRVTEKTASQYAELAPTRIRWHPLPFFGSLDRARVITLGLNPSTNEFTRQRNWPFEITSVELAERLVNYWNVEIPGPHPWFRPWSTVLTDMGASYALDAAHVDLSPRPTNGRKSELRTLFISMLQTDALLWMEALNRAPNCKLILAAGSATNDSFGYINEFIANRLSPTGVRLAGCWRRQRGEGQTAWQTIRLPEGREVPLFFCSTGPTRHGGATLVNACRANMEALRHCLKP